MCSGAFGVSWRRGRYPGRAGCPLLGPIIVLTECKTRGLCLHAWKLFSRLLLRDGDEKTLGLYRYRQHICKPSYRLRSYTQPLISPSADFITHLVISGGCEFSTNEMLCLAEMKNLGVLEIIQPADELWSAFPEVTDRLVRGWSEKEDPFPLLRVLRIWGDQSTTQESFRWVSKFPALALYDVMGSREDWTRPHEYAVEEGWELAESASRLQDSLLRYLMLLAPEGDIRLQRHKEMARSIDSDLVALCRDSRCAVKFVDHGQAPELLDYLTDTAKVHTPSWDIDATARESRFCRGAAFEAWAFWLYAFIGQLHQDRDMEARGERPESQTVAGPFVLPSKPVACLFLGHSARGGISAKPSYVSRGLFATKRYTFTRPNVVRGSRFNELAAPQDTKPAPAPVADPKTNGSVRAQKRKRMNDVLSSLMG